MMNVLSFTEPAKNWDEAFPVGNGRLAAMVYGNPEHEIIQLNEESVWSGAHLDRNNPSARKFLSQMKLNLRDKKFSETKILADFAFLGIPTNATTYQSAGEIHIDFCSGTSSVFAENAKKSAYTMYKRTLDFETAIATTTFSLESAFPSTADFSRNTRGSSVTFTREVFASASSNVLLIHISSSLPKEVSLSTWITRGNFTGKTYSLSDDTVVMENTSGIPYSIVMTASASGGTLHSLGGRLIVEGADDVTLFVDIKTAYAFPHYKRKGGYTHRSSRSLATLTADLALRNICFASVLQYPELREEHIEEYLPLYRNLNCELPSNPQTETLLAYTRYLLISSSRQPGKLPPPVCSLWTTENYLKPSELYPLNEKLLDFYNFYSALGFLEGEKSFLPLLKQIRHWGKNTACIMYRAEGFAAHSATDIWGDSAPIGTDFPESCAPLGAAYLALFIREYYEYTMDLNFLRKNYHLLCQASEFFFHTNVPKEILGDSGANTICALLKATLDSAKALRIKETDSCVLSCNRVLQEILKSTEDSKTECVKEEVVCQSFSPKCLYTNALYLSNGVRSLAKSTLTERDSAPLVEIEFFSAKNTEWKTGNLANLNLKGNLLLDFSWKDGRLVSAKLRSAHPTRSVKNVAILYDGHRYETQLSQDGTLDIFNVLPSTMESSEK